MPLWWNWQTRWTQNPVVVIPYRFDPDQRHQKCPKIKQFVLILGHFNVFQFSHFFSQDVAPNQKSAQDALDFKSNALLCKYKFKCVAYQLN